jgi:hypothetical protein
MTTASLSPLAAANFRDLRLLNEKFENEIKILLFPSTETKFELKTNREIKEYYEKELPFAKVFSRVDPDNCQFFKTLKTIANIESLDGNFSKFFVW